MPSSRLRSRKDASSFHGPDIGNQVAPLRPQIFHIGCAGWNIPRQNANDFESEGTHLQRYSRTFNCCEINSSFYRPHRYSTWERWAAAVPEDFRFSVKVPRAITHDAGLKCESESLGAFLTQVGFLGRKLGPILVQLPPSGVFDQTVAKHFFKVLRELYDGDVVLEARHGSWFGPGANGLLKEFRIAGVAADPACVPLAGQPTGSKKLVYFRLHGSPRRYYSSYSGESLETIAKQLGKFAEQAGVWCIFDNTAGGFATPNALQLSAAINTREHKGTIPQK